jgi:hypothetical protein
MKLKFDPTHDYHIQDINGIFEENDQLKTNTVLQMKDVGIDYKVLLWQI